MNIIAWILWIAIWGATGYFTVRTIKMRIEYREFKKQVTEYLKSIE